MQVSTDDVPARERFGFWHAVNARTWVPYELQCEPGLEGRFQARLSSYELGTVQLTLMTSTPYTIHRTAKLIRQQDPGFYKLGIAIRGSGSVSSDDRYAEFKAGDLILYDTSRTYTAALNPDVPSSQLLVLSFARAQLPLPPSDLDRLTMLGIQGSTGVGALASQFLQHLARHINEYSLADAARLSTLALDTLVTALAHQLDSQHSVAPETRHRALLARIYAFIEANLADPNLTPASIAEAHHISLRHLHKLFHEHDRTIAAWIRERRLDRCRHDLIDPLLATQPISAIGARWGFPNPAHFSQAFRAAYHQTPRDYRKTHTKAPSR